MKQLLAALLDKIIGAGFDRKIVGPEVLYRFEAFRHGVEYIGIFDKHRVALFQDPVTGSSFAVREGEPVESGISRVRTRFGLS